MKIWQALALAGAVCVSAGMAAAEQAPYPQTEEALQAEYDSLGWQFEPTTYQLATSHSNMTLPQGYVLLTGDDAQRMLYLDNGVEFPATEAIVASTQDGSYVSFEYFDSGYVSDGDWSELDADVLIDEIRESTEASNEERAKHGVAGLHVKEWRERPRYDAETRTAYWTLELTSDSGPVINATIIRLNRNGYHQLTWVGATDLYAGSGKMVDAVLKGHAYEPGFRYADFTDGDKVAAFGIASLVAVTAGGKEIKGIIATIVAAALIFLKKGWIVILAVFGGGWAAVKRFFGRRKAAAPVAAERTDTPEGEGTM
jgi:uncharacterized membrane-anchored protein